MRSEIQEKIDSRVVPYVAGLANLAIKDDEVAEILTYITTRCADIKMLDLDGNQLTVAAAAALADAVSKLSDLQQLSLQNNQFDKAGAQEIFAIKRDNPSLDIAFHGNKITDVLVMANIESEATSQSSGPSM